MKAFALTDPTEPARILEVEPAAVTADGVRIKVRAASVNGFDVFEANGYLVPMMEHVFPTVIGRDFAGTVEEVGADRDDVAVGDEVFGFVSSAPPLHDGTFTEAVIGSTGLVITPKPAALSFPTAAAIPLAGATALDSVDAVGIGAGDTVVVVGATGGVGSIAVQLAAQRGATVVATARAGDEEALIRSLGAAQTVDYSSGNLAPALRERYPDGVDALIDLVNREDAFAAMTDIVRDGGRVATTLGAADVDALAARGIVATNIMGAPTPAKLADLAEQVVAGTLRIEVQQTFPLSEAAAALAAFSAGTRGKIVLVVD